MRGSVRVLRGSTPVKNWADMTQAELTAALKAGRAEATKRVQELLQAAGLAPVGKRGRPSSNPYQLDGEDLEPADEESANGAAS